MSVINHFHRYVFMHEPHTAGRSIEHALMTQHRHSDNFNGDHHVEINEEFKGYTKFRVIRNPYDWLVTCWMRNCQNKSFAEWAFTDGLHFKKNGTLFWRYANKDTVDLRFERLQEQLTRLFISKYIPKVKLPIIGVTLNKSDWKAFLTVQQAVQLEKLYPDIIKYDYKLYY